MPKNQLKKRIILLGVVFILLTAFHYFGWLGFAERGARAVFVPVSRAAHNWKTFLSSKYSFWNSREELTDLYNKCSAAKQKFELDDAEKKLLEQENAELKKQLNFKARFAGNTLTTNVVGKNSDNIEKVIMIDAGEKDGVKTGQPVITGEGVLVGLVEKVNADVSMVRMINDSHSKVAATVLNKDKSLGVVEGGYGLSVRMNFIPRDEPITIGEEIVTSGLDTNIPRGLLIGKVAVAENEAYQPFQQAVLVTAANLEKLTVVSVLLY